MTDDFQKQLDEFTKIDPTELEAEVKMIREALGEQNLNKVGKHLDNLDGLIKEARVKGLSSE